MNYQVKISEHADQDLRGIFEYIAFELQSMQSAIGQLTRLEESIADLDHMPHRYRIYEREPWHTRGLRVMSVDNYLVFYQPNDKTHIVDIVRVIYGGRNIEEQLKRFTKN